MDARIPLPATPEEIFRTLWGHCQDFGTVESIQLFCQQDTPAEIVCVVDMTGNTYAAAAQLQAVGFGFSTLCKHLPVSMAFRCEMRPDGILRIPACNRCRNAGTQIEDLAGCEAA